jgi:hypothetical protein
MTAAVSLVVAELAVMAAAQTDVVATAEVVVVVAAL